MAGDERDSHAEGLGHADEGVVDGVLAVWVVFAEDITHYARGFFVGFVPVVAGFVHGVEDAAVHRFEAVTDIGEGAADDDAHGVVQIGAFHPRFKADGGEVAGEWGGRLVGH